MNGTAYPNEEDFLRRLRYAEACNRASRPTEEQVPSPGPPPLSPPEPPSQEVQPAAAPPAPPKGAPSGRFPPGAPPAAGGGASFPSPDGIPERGAPASRSSEALLLLVLILFLRQEGAGRELLLALAYVLLGGK